MRERDSKQLNFLQLVSRDHRQNAHCQPTSWLGAAVSKDLNECIKKYEWFRKCHQPNLETGMCRREEGCKGGREREWGQIQTTEIT